MALFLGLYLGHLLGDFVLQPGRLVIAKRSSLAGLLLHAGIVGTATAIVLLGTLRDEWPALVYATVAHLAVEVLTIRARRTDSASSLVVFLLDQGLHLVSLAIISYLAGTTRPPMLVFWPISLESMGSIAGVMTVAFLGSILAFEVMRTPSPDGRYDEVLQLDGPRLFGMVERGGALAVGLAAPFPVMGALVFMPRILYACTLPRDRRTRQLVSTAVGLTLCAVVYTLVVTLTRTTR